LHNTIVIQLKIKLIICSLSFVQAADGFLFVVQCDTGRIIYVSDSIVPVLHQSQVSHG